jgi:hypothetical protein
MAMLVVAASTALSSKDLTNFIFASLVVIR